MDTQNQVNQEASQATVKTAQKPYETPILREFGDVRELTRGGGATLSEGFSSKKSAG